MWSIWSSGIASSAVVPLDDEDDAHAVDQHQRLGRVRTAQEDSRHRTGATVRYDLDARLPLQQRQRGSARRCCAISSAPMTVTSATRSSADCGSARSRHDDRIEDSRSLGIWMACACANGDAAIATRRTWNNRECEPGHRLSGAAAWWTSDARSRHAVGTPHGHCSAQREASQRRRQARGPPRGLRPAVARRTRLRAATGPRAAVHSPRAMPCGRCAPVQAGLRARRSCPPAFPSA